MEKTEDVVIVGAGLAGLSTSLGLHRLGIRSLVLETSESLRVSGFALTVWHNAWKALEALGIAESLRQTHTQLQGFVVNSTSGEPSGEQLLGTTREKEARCVQRKLLLETLAEDLPEGTIRFGSKVVGIEESGFIKLVHLADGTILRTKVLVGCDGVNSVVAKWLGFKKPASTGRSAIRGFAHFQDGHGFPPKFQLFPGHGLRSGFIPCDHHTVYWFITYYPNQQGPWFPSQDAETNLENAEKMKRFVLDKLRGLPDFPKNMVEITSPDNIVLSPLKYRPPWEILFGNITKHNVCVAGDALHPMTPDIGQGGCSALEDGVVLARCLGRTALSAKQKPIEEEDEYRGIEMEMKRYSKERKWRSIDLVSTAYVVGFLQQRNGKMMNVLRDLFLSALLARLLLKKSGFDCGKLH